MTVQSVERGQKMELVGVYARAIARTIDHRGLRRGPYSRVLITSNVVRDGNYYRFTVWGPKNAFMGVWVDENSMKHRTVEVSEFFNSPRRSVPISKLFSTSEEIAEALWPEYQEVVFADAVGMVS